MAVEWCVTTFGASDFRLTRVEGEEFVKMDIVAEQPEGGLLAALQPFVLTGDDLAYELAVIRQQAEREGVDTRQ